MNKTFKYLPVLFLALIMAMAYSTTEAQSKKHAENNPPMVGFNQTASDVKAISIADEVMEAMGGRKAWDKTRHISWNFFNARTLIWDRYTGNVRVETTDNKFKALLNIHTMEGKVMKDGQLLTQPDSVKKYLEQAKSMWINDSYWLVMPYKLKDSGVTLTYIKEDTTEAGAPADVLQLTFEGVGRTPQNKYHVYVDKDSKVVTQWSFFREAAKETPDFTTPWKDYKDYGKIKLSGDRGERKITAINVDKKLPETAYTTF